MVTSVARALGLPAAQVQGVASFYTMFATKVPPRHSLRVCDSPPCWLRGAEQIRTVAEATVGENWLVERTSCLNRTTRHWDTLTGDSKHSLPPGEGEGEDGGEGTSGHLPGSPRRCLA